MGEDNPKSELSTVQQTNEQSAIRLSFDNEMFKTMLAMSERLVKGGAFSKSIQNPEQAFTIIQAGYEMGIAPIEALNGFYIVNGSIRPYGTTLTKRLRKHGWKVKIGQHDEKVCHVTITKHDEEYQYEATYAEVEKLRSQALQKSPKDKLYYHAISRLVRYFVPDVLASVDAVYEETDGEAYTPSNYNRTIDVVEAESPKLTLEEQTDLYNKWLVAFNNSTTIEQLEEMKEALKTDLTLFDEETQSLVMKTYAERISALKNVSPVTTLEGKDEVPVQPKETFGEAAARHFKEKKAKKAEAEPFTGTVEPTTNS